MARGPDVTRVRAITQLFVLRVTVESYTTPKGPLQCKRCQRFGHTQRGCGYAPRCVACGEAHLSGVCSTSKEQLKCCSCGGSHTANYRVCGKWTVAKAALVRRATTGHVMKSGAPSGGRSAPARPQPSPEQLSLNDDWNHVLRGGRIAKAQTASPPNPVHRSLKPLKRLKRQAPARMPGVRRLP